MHSLTNLSYFYYDGGLIYIVLYALRNSSVFGASV